MTPWVTKTLSENVKVTVWMDAPKRKKKRRGLLESRSNSLESKSKGGP